MCYNTFLPRAGKFNDLSELFLLKIPSAGGIFSKSPLNPKTSAVVKGLHYVHTFVSSRPVFQIRTKKAHLLLPNRSGNLHHSVSHLPIQNA